MVSRSRRNLIAYHGRSKWLGASGKQQRPSGIELPAGFDM